MKIVLYGLGRGLELVEKNLREEHEIIGYSDSFSEINIFHGKPFYSPLELSTVDFDYLIITVRNRKESWKLYEMLTDAKHGLNRCKIIPVYVYVKREYWDVRMSCADDNVEGLILGTSYARRGIYEEYLSVPFVNLSVPSQNLYDDLEIFKACVNKYEKKLYKLKYILIDMFDYNYFNFDNSLCKLFFSYLEYGGIIKEHNYKSNCNYVNEFEHELFFQTGIKKDCSVEKVLNNLFVENIIQIEEKMINDRWKHINYDEPLPVSHFMAHIANKKDEKVIGNNMDILEELLKSIWDFNSNIKVVLFLLPKYITLEQSKDIIMIQWKKEFLQTISKFCNKPNIYFKNYKFCEGISNNNYFWFDIDHLNTIGAKCMTSIIDNDLIREVY